MTAFIQLRVVLLCGLLGYPAVACGKGKEGVSVMVPEQASRGELVEMAVKVRPSARQLDYQQREMLGFIHLPERNGEQERRSLQFSILPGWTPVPG